MLDLAILLHFGLSYLWRFISWIWYSLLTIKWRLDGLTNTIEVNQCAGMYHNSAQVMTIIGRYCFDKIMTRNSKSDFLVIHKKFVHPGYVLSDECSLYSISEHEVLFVEAPLGLDVSKLEFGSFHRLAQFNHAIRVIAMPRYAFHRLAEEVGYPRSKVIFLEYLPRTGSTLACKMFESTKKCVAISEPNIFMEYVTNIEELTTNLIAGVKLLCKPRNQEVQPLAFVLKVTPTKPKVFKVLTEEFNSSQLFIYRAPIKSVCSLVRMSNLSPTLRLEKALMALFPGMKSKFIPRLSGRGVDTTVARDLVLKFQDFVVLSSFFLWAGLLDAYQKQINGEFSSDIPSVKYEHILKNPEASTKAIFQHVGLPEDLVPLALSAMLEDSQKVSIVNRKSASKYSVMPDPKGKLAEDLLVLSGLLGLSGYEDLDLSNTITTS